MVTVSNGAFVPKRNFLLGLHLGCTYVTETRKFRRLTFDFPVYFGRMRLPSVMMSLKRLGIHWECSDVCCFYYLFNVWYVNENIGKLNNIEGQHGIAPKKHIWWKPSTTLCTLESGRCVLLIHLDTSAAFDTITIDRLLSSLVSKFNKHESTHAWTHRHAHVRTYTHRHARTHAQTIVLKDINGGIRSALVKHFNATGCKTIMNACP